MFLFSFFPARMRWKKPINLFFIDSRGKIRLLRMKRKTACLKLNFRWKLNEANFIFKHRPASSLCFPHTFFIELLSKWTLPWIRPFDTVQKWYVSRANTTLWLQRILHIITHLRAFFHPFFTEFRIYWRIVEWQKRKVEKSIKNTWFEFLETKDESITNLEEFYQLSLVFFMFLKNYKSERMKFRRDPGTTNIS